MGRGPGKTSPPPGIWVAKQVYFLFFFQTGLLKCTQHHWSSLIIRQMQINTTMSDHLIPSEWLFPNDSKWKIGKNVEKREFWYTLAENINQWSHYKTQEGGSLKTKNRTTIVKRKVKVAQSCVTPWTVACQALLSMEFSRQKYLSALPCPPPGDLPNPGINQVSHIAGGFFTVCAIREAKNTEVNSLSLLMESSQPRNRTGVSCIAGGTTICSSNSALVIYLKKMKSLTQRDIWTLHVHCTNIYSSQDVETNLCLSTYEWIKEMCTKVHRHTHTQWNTIQP